MNFQNFKQLKNREIAPILTILGRNGLQRPNLVFKKFCAVEKFFVGPIRTEISARPIRDRRSDRTGPVFGTDPMNRTNIAKNRSACTKIFADDQDFRRRPRFSPAAEIFAGDGTEIFAGGRDFRRQSETHVPQIFNFWGRRRRRR